MFEPFNMVAQLQKLAEHGKGNVQALAQKMAQELCQSQKS
jgi:hypothetical protein